MKRGATAIELNDHNKRVKKPSTVKSLAEILAEVSNGCYDNFRNWLAERKSTELELSQRVGTTVDLYHLGKSLHATKIRSVNLEMNNINGFRAKEFITALRGCSNVTKVKLNTNNIGPQGATDVATALNGTAITILHLEDNLIGPTDIENFAIALKKTSVIHVYLDANKIGDIGAKALAEGLHDSRVKNISICGNNISSAGATDFITQLNGKDIQIVDLSDNEIKAEGAKGLGLALQKSPINKIYLNENKLGPIGARDFMEGAKGSRLIQVDLTSNNIGNSGFKDVAERLKDTLITDLNLANNNIGEDDISEDDISEDDISEIAAVFIHSNVRNLDLSQNNLNDIGAQSFVKGLKDNTKLKILTLDWNFITSTGASNIGIALQNTAISIIDLEGNEIDNTGAINLIASLKKACVTIVDLSANEIDEIGIATILSSIEGTLIESIDFKENSVSGPIDPKTADHIRKSALCELTLPNPEPAIMEAVKQNREERLTLRKIQYIARYLAQEKVQRSPHDQSTTIDKATPEQQFQFFSGILENVPSEIAQHILTFLPHMNTQKVQAVFTVDKQIEEANAQKAIMTINKMG